MSNPPGFEFEGLLESLGLPRKVRCDMSVVRLSSALADPIVSQLTTMTPQDTGAY